MLDISDLEILRPYLIGGKIGFRDCIMRRIQRGMSGFLSFRDYFREYQEQVGVEVVADAETVARFRAVMDRVSQRFFHRPFEPRDQQG